MEVTIEIPKVWIPARKSRIEICRHIAESTNEPRGKNAQSFPEQLVRFLDSLKESNTILDYTIYQGRENVMGIDSTAVTTRIKFPPASENFIYRIRVDSDNLSWSGSGSND